MAQPRLIFWGWGYEGEVLAPGEVWWLERMWAQQFRVRQFDLTPPTNRRRNSPAPFPPEHTSPAAIHLHH